MSDTTDNLHIHCTEITGVAGVSHQGRQLPCSKCGWGHDPDRVERVARAIWVARGKSIAPTLEWIDAYVLNREDVLQEARAAIAAMGALE